MNMITLIGGSNDGRKVKQVNPIPFLKMSVLEPINLYMSMPIDPLAEMKVELYRLELLASEKRRHQVYIHEDLTMDQALEKLLTNHNPS